MIATKGNNKASLVFLEILSRLLWQGAMPHTLALSHSRTLTHTTYLPQVTPNLRSICANGLDTSLLPTLLWLTPLIIR